MNSELSSIEIIRSLYDLYSNGVYRYALATLGDSSEAYDAVQEVYLRAFRSVNNYRHDSSAKTWLMTIARNYIFDVLRKRRTERKYIADGEIPDVADTSTASAQVVLEVQQALRHLNDDHRQAIVLRHIENFSVNETATILGWSERKVQNTTYRALLKLRGLLSNDSKEVKLRNEIR